MNVSQSPQNLSVLERYTTVFDDYLVISKKKIHTKRSCSLYKSSQKERKRSPFHSVFTCTVSCPQTHPKATKVGTIKKMRRRPGIHGIQQAAAAREQQRTMGAELQEHKIERMRAQVTRFKESLESFALAHRDDIRRDPEFRQRFHAMCAHIGVDPLVSNKTTWAQKLGLGDFYYGLAVTILDVCKTRRAIDGGLTALGIVFRLVSQRRGTRADPITEEDIIRAIEKLSVLGSGFGIVEIRGRKYVRSVPAELSNDGNDLIDLAHRLGGFFRHDQAVRQLKWPPERVSDGIAALARDGLLLVDDPPLGKARIYWCPAVPMDLAVDEFKRKEMDLTLT